MVDVEKPATLLIAHMHRIRVHWLSIANQNYATVAIPQHLDQPIAGLSLFVRSTAIDLMQCQV